MARRTAGTPFKHPDCFISLFSQTDLGQRPPVHRGKKCAPREKEHCLFLIERNSNEKNWSVYKALQRCAVASWKSFQGVLYKKASHLLLHWPGRKLNLCVNFTAIKPFDIKMKWKHKIPRPCEENPAPWDAAFKKTTVHWISSQTSKCDTNGYLLKSCIQCNASLMQSLQQPV